MLELVETQTNDHSAPMLWVLPNLSIADLITEFEELKLSLSMLTKIGLIDLVNDISTELIALNALKKIIL